MAFDPHAPTRADALAYFRSRSEVFPEVPEAIAVFFSQPNLSTARALASCYFARHQVGDLESLRRMTSCFADKRLVRAVVQSILDDDAAVQNIAARSYPHPIGFDKLVLDDDRATGFKLRLHVYWRGANFAALERLHLHRFEMASAIITGELSNHLWHVKQFQSEHPKCPRLVLKPNADGQVLPFFAYAGYLRDAQGDLRKAYLGPALLARGTTSTFSSGEAYAQLLEDAHFVETNAETGFANGDFCSTIYIHGPSLTDAAGRTLPILFEEHRLPDDNQKITPIANLTPSELRQCLLRYRDVLDEILKFYDWLYDPKHGRNLSTGMIAGYLLCEAFQTPHAIDVFERRYDDCKQVLQHHQQTLQKILEENTWHHVNEMDRNTRYLKMLVSKAMSHPHGPRQWLQESGQLMKEMWRYFGALRGEVNPRITVLKPIWERVVRKKLPGGMHHGHIAAMIEAAFEANRQAMLAFDEPLTAVYADDRHVSCAADRDIEELIRSILQQHYPGYRFHGEEQPDTVEALAIGTRQFLIDPIDGTRNYLNSRLEFAVSIACRTWTGTTWETTDAVVSHPPTGRIFWAERGHGAFLIERNDREQRLKIPERTFGDQPLHRLLIDLSARGLGLAQECRVYQQLLASGAVLRNTGCVAMMLAQLARQPLGGAIITAQPHDTEAGLLILQEAGGQFQYLHGQNFPIMILGTHAAIVEALTAVVNG